MFVSQHFLDVIGITIHEFMQFMEEQPIIIDSTKPGIQNSIPELQTLVKKIRSIGTDRGSIIAGNIDVWVSTLQIDEIKSTSIREKLLKFLVAETALTMQAEMELSLRCQHLAELGAWVDLIGHSQPFAGQYSTGMHMPHLQRPFMPNPGFRPQMPGGMISREAFASMGLPPFQNSGGHNQREMMHPFAQSSGRESMAHPHPSPDISQADKK